VMTIAGQAAAETAGSIAAALPRQLLIGMQVLEQLRTRRIAYRVDPASAYADLSQSAGSIDFLQFPAETLAYGAGDCDDLSVLYNSILEASGVRTAFITTPGHIFTAFSVDRDVREISGIFPDTGEFIAQGGRVWIPVETTALDLGFREAWQIGARQWRAAESNRSATLFTTEDAWRIYPPVPWEPPVTQGGSRRSTDQFASELEDYVSEAIELMIQDRDVSEPGTARDHNLRGTIYARFGLLDEARQAFERAISMADYVPALVNLASVTALGGDHAAAREILEQADGLSPDNPRILLGLAVEHLEDGQRGSARGFYDRAAAIDPRLTTDFPLFAAAESGDSLAAGQDAVMSYRENAWAE
jgi:tetratricopeptide repeat protein